jgi:O-antigen/teichoic acid export membrane protein
LTHKLSSTEYGVLAVLITVIALMAGVTQFGLGSAFFRAYSYDYESRRDRLGVLSTVVALLTLISIPTAFAIILTAPWLTEFLFKSSSFSGPVRLAAVVILLQNLAIPGLSWLRAENRVVCFTVLSTVNLLVNLCATIILVGVLHLGISGALIAIGGGYGVFVICTLPVILLRAGLHLRFDIARNVLSFGLPNVASLVAIWVLQLSDRYLLAHLSSLSQTASYSVAYSLGGVLGVVVLSPFQLAWPTAMYTIAKKANASQIFQSLFRWYSVILLFAAYALSLVATLVLDVLFPPAYHSASTIIPIIAVSIMFYGVFNYVILGVSILRKTWLAVIFTSVAALVNVGLNLVLIPHFGSMGAAVSTLIAYLVLALLGYAVNQRIYPVPFEIGIFMIALLIGTAIYICSNFLVQVQQIYVAWSISFGALGLYGGCLVLLSMLLAWSHKYKLPQKQEGPVS